MPTKWDRFAETVRRTQAALGFADTLAVYEPTESYSAGDGYDVTYPGTATATIDAEITTPDARGERDRGGTTVDADVIIYVRDDTGLALTEFGDSGNAAARLEDVVTGARYEVEAVMTEHNGLLRIGASEV